MNRRTLAVKNPRGARRPSNMKASSLSLRDVAYKVIKHRIITCGFKPGEYVNELAVCALLDMGRTPVHQALDRLMLEGLVEVVPRKGVIVKPISYDEVMQIIQVRLINETSGVRLAAERASSDEIKHLQDVLVRADHWIRTGNNEQLMLLDSEFHSVIATATKNAVLADLLSKLNDRSLRFWFVSLNAPGHHANVQTQHKAILAGIKSHDASAAEEAMRAHIEAFRRNVFQLI